MSAIVLPFLLLVRNFFLILLYNFWIKLHLYFTFCRQKIFIESLYTHNALYAIICVEQIVRKKGLWWMKRESTLAKMISTAGERAAYDNACKKLLANKVILAWIMKSCLEEYRDCELTDIALKYIESDVQISENAVFPDEELESCQITGLNTEDNTINEGTVTYDIKFRAIIPGTGEKISLIINIEAQNDFYPGYPIVKRNLHYCCRLVSSQYGTEFTNSHYEKIKKVYSIFICMNPPKYRKNTINQYSIREEELAGKYQEEINNYDLLTALIICLGDADAETATGILRLLEVLLSSERNAKEKKRILENDFGIKMTGNLEKEVSEMCNLSEGVERRGIAKGIASSAQKLMSSMGWTIEQALDALQIPEKERENYIDMLKE